VASAFLTLVALQLSTSGNLPDVDYLLMLDQIYIASYAGVLLVLAMIVASSRRAERESAEQAWRHRGGLVAVGVATLYGLVVAGIIILNGVGGTVAA
jgi:hypothetical protein